MVDIYFSNVKPSLAVSDVLTIIYFLSKFVNVTVFIINKTLIDLRYYFYVIFIDMSPKPAEFLSLGRQGFIAK